MFTGALKVALFRFLDILEDSVIYLLAHTTYSYLHICISYNTYVQIVRLCTSVFFFRDGGREWVRFVLVRGHARWDVIQK